MDYRVRFGIQGRCSLKVFTKAGFDKLLRIQNEKLGTAVLF